VLLLDVVLVLVGGFLAGRLAELARLPALLGMLLYGIAIGPFGLAVLSEEFVAQSPTVSVVALVTVIIASFFAIDLAVLRRDARTIVLVGVIPGLIEGFTIMVAAVALLDFTWVQGAILGFTLAVVSPAVVVPTMIRLKDAGWGMDKDIPVLVLAATNLDGLVAVILWLVFVTIETGGGDIAEVSTVAISEILLGAILGLVLGRLAALLADRTLGRTPTWLRTVVLLAASLAVFFSSEVLPVNGPVALLAFGLTLVNTTHLELTPVGTAVGRIWSVAAILLFVLIGSVADLDTIGTVGLVGVLIIGVGVVARLAGALLALSGSPLNRHERLFVGIGTTGKATVQATLAPLVVALGIANGETILAIAVMAILLMSVIASLAIQYSYRSLLAAPTTQDSS